MDASLDMMAFVQRVEDLEWLYLSVLADIYARLEWPWLNGLELLLGQPEDAPPAPLYLSS